MSKTNNPKQINLSNKRIPRIDRIRTAYIMWEDIPIATISEESDSISGQFDWVIRPIWENWKRCEERGEFVDIAGIDDTLHKSEYIRRYLPIFVTQRTPSDRRPDLQRELAEVRLKTYDRFEYMCRSHSACGNDNYYVSRTPDKVINVNALVCEFDSIDDMYDIVPDAVSDAYGWLDEPIITE